MENPLRLPEQELLAAWTAAHRMRATVQFEEMETEYRNVLNDLEKLWIKTERNCQQFGNRFVTWQKKYRDQRSSDPLLLYFYQSRHVDNHTAQSVSYLIGGYLQIQPGLSFSILDNPLPSVGEVVNRGITYQPPQSHLGKALHTKDPRELCVHACNYYADFLRDVKNEFFASGP